MIEHLFDEALVNALRRGDSAMNRADVESARLTEEIGMGQPVAYTPHEKRLIATHESGHATMAHLVAPHRRLEVLSIIKRRDALGMLAHGDSEDVFTRSRTEMLALIQIAMGGQVAEELFFGDISTGPGGDLSYATTVAAQMVGAVGMGGSLVSLAAVQQGALADSNLVGRVLVGLRRPRCGRGDPVRPEAGGARAAQRQPAHRRGTARCADRAARAGRSADRRGHRLRRAAGGPAGSGANQLTPAG